jgi:hypothetical protein
VSTANDFDQALAYRSSDERSIIDITVTDDEPWSGVTLVLTRGLSAAIADIGWGASGLHIDITFYRDGSAVEASSVLDLGTVSVIGG